MGDLEREDVVLELGLELGDGVALEGGNDVSDV